MPAKLALFARGIATLECNFGPAVDPSDGGNLEIRMARCAVVGMKNDDVAVFLLGHGLSAGPEPAAISQQ